jgi:uncharacterized membrane protein YdbT with pleckstrin-like domain
LFARARVKTYNSQLSQANGHPRVGLLQDTLGTNIRVPGLLALSEGEQPVWYGRQSYASYAGSIIFGFIIVFFVFVLAGISGQVGFLWFTVFAFFDWILVLLSVISTEYFVSNKRIFIKRGIFGRASHDLKIEWMTGTIVHQGIFGRILNFGDVSFTGVGFSGDVKMNGVSDVLVVKGIVENVIQTSKEHAQALRQTTMQQVSTSPGQRVSDQMPPSSGQGTKFCQFCGSKMPTPAVFCPSCGKQQL